MVTPYFTQRKLFVSLFFFILSLSVFAQSTIYVGGHFRREREKAVPKLKESGFTCAILFNITVEPNGDLTTDKELICSDGVYRFHEVHPNYIDDVNALVTGRTSITRLETCVGGWDSPSYGNIKKLVEKQGTGPNSILYKNFKAFKEAIPIIEAVNNDIEDTYDVDTSVEFHAMLYELGYKTTIVPFQNKSYWEKFVNKLHERHPGAVDRNYLQCYVGGKDNHPKDWVIGDIPLHVGLEHFDGPVKITSKMNTWKKEAPVVGGFLWIYNDENDINLRSCSAAINIIFGGGEVVNMDVMTPHTMAYTEKNYKGNSMPFEVGTHTSYALGLKGFQPDKLSSISLHEGFIMEVFYEEDGKKRSVVLDESIPDIEALGLPSDPTYWTVAINGDESITHNKTYYMKNRQTGLYMTIAEDNTTNGTLIQQKPLNKSKSQQWTFGHLGRGAYRIVNKFSDRVLQIIDDEEENKGQLRQYTYNNQRDNQKFVSIYDGESNTYKFICLSTLGYISVLDEKEEPDAYIGETYEREDLLNDWELIAESEVSVKEIADNSISVYPIPANHILHLESFKVINKIIINDISGCSLLIKEKQSDSIDISSLSDGIYILTVLFEDNTPAYVTKISKKIK